MRALAAVFAREVFDRRLVFPVALASGFVPLVGSRYYGWSSPGAAEARIFVALVGAAALSLAFAILFGGSVIAGETSEKRISFFFSRPLPAAAIWGGKLLAVLFLTFVPAALVLVPAFLTSTTRANQEVIRLGGTPGAVLGLFLVTLFVILGAHAAVTFARLRSRWLSLDALFAGLWTAGVGLCAHTLLRNGALPRPHLLSSAPFWAFFALVIVFALAATYVQVAEGRTDARRAHGAFSVTLWGLLGSGLVVLSGYAWWVASARATDLATVEGGVLAAPRGSWLSVGGPLRAARGTGAFLFDAAGARSVRLHGYDAVFSPDGTRAAWGEPRFGFFERKDNRVDVFVADLATGRTVATGLEASGWTSLAFSPSGRRLAVRDGRSLSVFDVSNAANPRQLAAFPVPDGSRGFAFVDEDTVRLFPRFYNPVNRKDIAPPALEVTELFLSSKKSLVTGRFERDALPHLRVSADGRTLVGVKDKRLTLHDGRTGALVATLSDDLESPRLRLLSGRCITVVGVTGGKGVLKIFLEGEEGQPPTPVRTIDLGPAGSAVLGGEIAPGRVAVALNPFQRNPSSSESRSAWTLAIVDVESGKTLSTTPGLVPADRFSWWFSPVLPPAEAGLPSASLFLDASGRLVRLDPATGAQTVRLGRSK